MPVYVVSEGPTTRASLAKLSREATRHMFGTTCRTRSSLERECFTAQRCTHDGHAWRSDPGFAQRGIAIVAVDARDMYKGSLQAERVGTAWFVYNVCVVAHRRGSGVCEELFAHLARLVRNTPVELTVFLARGEGSLAEAVAHARAPKVLRLYARMGFVVTRVQGGPFVHMRAERLCVGAPQQPLTRLT